MPVAKISQQALEVLSNAVAPVRMAQHVVEVLAGPYVVPTLFVTGAVGLPTMTSNTAPSGVCSASSSYGTTPPWKAFDGGASVGWSTNAGGVPAWIGYQFASPVTIEEYSFRAWWTDTYPGRTPKTWKFQGSSDGTTWVDLDSQTNWVCPNSSVYTTFHIASPASYAYYRLYVTANNGDAYVGVGGLRMFIAASPLYALVSQDVVEVLVIPVPPVRVSQHVVEVLMSGDGFTGGGGGGGVKSFGFTT